jgi:hypothetical protein
MAGREVLVEEVLGQPLNMVQEQPVLLIQEVVVEVLLTGLQQMVVLVLLVVQES